MSDSHGDVGSDVVHALDADERRAFERHAHECPTCRLEQQEFDETLAELTLLSATAPPERLRSELLAAVARIRPLPPLLRRPEASETVVEFRRRPRVVALLTGLVAAALAVSLSLGVWVHDLGEQHRTDVAAAGAESQLLSAPDAKIYAATLAERPVSYVVSRQRGQAVVVGDELPDPGAGHSYQLWRITATGPVPAGLVPHGGTLTGWFVGPLDGVTGLAVTIERNPGAQQPTPPIRSSVRI